jgi:hypothetical protein
MPLVTNPFDVATQYATLITRTPMIDDDGSGEVGTVINNAWKTELYNQIDAAIAGSVNALIVNGTFAIPSYIALTPAGGTYHDWAHGAAGKVVWGMQPSGPMTITGIVSAGEPLGAMHLLTNMTGYAITITNYDPLSLGQNRIALPGTYVLGTWKSLWLRFSENMHWVGLVT